MEIIPVLKCKNMSAAIAFYIGILDFKLRYPDDVTPDDVVVDLIKGNITIQLSVIDGKFGTAVNIRLDSDVDELFQKYLLRGLDTSKKKKSPVHQGPVNQTWGIREFYVTDTDKNTLRFGVWL